VIGNAVRVMRVDHTRCRIEPVARTIWVGDPETRSGSALRFTAPPSSQPRP